ncbi:MipA/OmpV family protein [Undibacterium sp. Jales W-56]|uniref:MipA/OmpV family protein n=1 Tax=Undibacterium sp. Jales W-56 TaxID=2897325 RepID=UPI0021CE35F2|nr:MipA/OmpV family protein [Undibacterium sp. Jales W-56]MCU6433765.1 MipA/OmpV family protein [Undibacterium sp. Jales W-56]
MKKFLPLLLVCASLAANAQTSEYAQLVPSPYLPKDVNFSLGAAAYSAARYTGSDERRLAAYPLLDAQWRNGAFASTISGFGYNFSKDPNLQYGLRMTVEAARDESRSDRLHGLGDVGAAIEPGAFLNYIVNQNYSLTSSVRYGSGVDHNGLQLSLGGRATTSLNTQHRLSASFGANWANAAFAQSYFGVNAAQSAASGYTQYTPSAGLTDVKVGATWNWSIDSNWSLTTGASVKYLTGDASRSPFVFQKTPVTIFSAASYRF